MIVIGADTHKRSHTVAAVEAVTGRALGERTVSARQRPRSMSCSPGRAVTAPSACGRSRTAGTSRARSSGSCSPAARPSSGSRPS